MKNIFLILLTSLSLFAEDFPKTNIRYVLIQSGVLNLRESPVNGKVIAKLKAGEKVTILEDATNDESWKKVKTNSNITGYVSNEFLGFFSTTEIQKGKLMGIVGRGDSRDNMNKAALRILGGSFSGKWYGYNESGDFIYLMNYLANGKKSLEVLDNSKKVGSFTPIGIAKYGCQEYRGLQGNTSSPNFDDKFFIGAFGIKESKVNFSTTEKIEEVISSKIQKEATAVFKKNNISDAQIKSSLNKEIISFTAGNGKNYIVARYAINKEHAELHFISLVAEVTKDKNLKLIHSRFQSLSEEVGSYGGGFHFMGIIDLDGSGMPAILFHHIGFDSGVYEIFQILNDKIESLFLGGGDAC